MVIFNKLLYSFFAEKILSIFSCCCCCCCLRSVTALFPRGQLPKEDLRRSPSTTQATRHPWALSQSLFPLPPYLCHASCIRSVPSPVLLSYTYTLSSLWSVSSLFFCPTHIFKPRRKEPLNKHQTPHTNCVNSLFQ